MICVSPLGQGRCVPGCSLAAPYCHGRCEGGGGAAGACLLHPCSASPYPEEVPATCARLALAAGAGQCRQCSSASAPPPASCQGCLEASLPAPCTHLSGAPCWHCAPSLQTLWTHCAQSQAAVLLSRWLLQNVSFLSSLYNFSSILKLGKAQIELTPKPLISENC